MAVRRVQFEEPQAEGRAASSGAGPLCATPARLRDAGCDLAEPEDAGGENAGSPSSPGLDVQCAGCDVAAKPGSGSPVSDNVNASLPGNSLCADPLADNRSFTDDFNPLSLDSNDSINLTSRSEGHTQSVAEGKEEVKGADPIPANAQKTADGKCFPCANPGNPVFSCMQKIPVSPHSPTPFVKPQNPLYRTTSADYGSNEPTCDIAPSVYKPLSQSFSEVLCTTGMYRNRSLNTGLDKKRIHDLLPM